MSSGSPTVIDHMRKSGKTVIEATREAQDQWVEHVNEVVGMTLMPSANSWYMSANIPGKPRAFLPYLDPAGVGGYRKRCDEIAAKGYEGFALACIDGTSPLGISTQQSRQHDQQHLLHARSTRPL